MLSKKSLTILSAVCTGMPMVSAQSYTLRDIYNAGNWLNMFQFQAVRVSSCQNALRKLIS